MKFLEERVSRGKFEGKTFLFTGELSSLTRGRAEQRVREEGGEVAKSISKRVDYLVVGVNPGSKLQKAKKLGVKELSENEFLEIIRSAAS